MILIADSGSTTTDWGALKKDRSIDFQTAGFNPFFTDQSKIIDAITFAIQDLFDPNNIRELWFYGAGCSSNENCLHIEEALSKLFKNASLHVEHDLLGAARASCGTSAGIACILGTGSNSCEFDGKNIIDNIPGLGHILGDEGSGSHLGKSLLKAFFYRELPDDLERDFIKKLQLSKPEILDRIYKKSQPNRFLASFTYFLSDHIRHPFIRQLVFNCFDEYTGRHILKYERARELPVFAVGSVAYYFKDILKECFSKHNILLKEVLQRPIENLKKYHSSQ